MKCRVKTHCCWNAMNVKWKQENEEVFQTMDLVTKCIKLDLTWFFCKLTRVIWDQTKDNLLKRQCVLAMDTTGTPQQKREMEAFDCINVDTFNIFCCLRLEHVTVNEARGKVTPTSHWCRLENMSIGKTDFVNWLSQIQFLTSFN